MVAIVIMGILAGIAAPSLLSQKKTFKRAVNSVETLVKTVNLSARANSGTPYRIVLATQDRNGVTQQFLRVDYSRNGNCDPAREQRIWQEDPRKQFILPDQVMVESSGANEFPTIAASNGICFDGRGMTFGGAKNFMLSDTSQEGGAVSARLTISAVGDISRETKNRDGNVITGGKLD